MMQVAIPSDTVHAIHDVSFIVSYMSLSRLYHDQRVVSAVPSDHYASDSGGAVDRCMKIVTEPDGTRYLLVTCANNGPLKFFTFLCGASSKQAQFLQLRMPICFLNVADYGRYVIYHFAFDYWLVCTYLDKSCWFTRTCSSVIWFSITTIKAIRCVAAKYNVMAFSFRVR